MDKVCEICQKPAKYKCPRCYIYYCSVPCSKEHKKAACEDKSTQNKPQDDQKTEGKKEIDWSLGVPKEKLELLDHDEELKSLLTNKHLRDLLVTIDQAENAEEIMHYAMQEPIFVEFADACLRVVDPDSEDEK